MPPLHTMPQDRFEQMQTMYTVHANRDGEVSIRATLNRLQKYGHIGAFYMGELCLQEAAKQPEDAQIWLDHGYDYLDAAAYDFSDRGLDASNAIGVRARLRIAEAPLLGALLLQGILPELSDAKISQIASLEVAKDLLEFDESCRSHDSSRELKGCTSTLVTRLLANHYSIKHNLTDKWYAYNALVFDTLMKPNDELHADWDIGVWTTAHTIQPKLDHKLQVKTKRQYTRKYASDIRVLSVDPDLQLHKRYNNLSIEILREFTSGDVTADANLNNRAIKLLDIVGH
jgi:hypothetical protein